MCGCPSGVPNRFTVKFSKAFAAGFRAAKRLSLFSCSFSDELAARLTIDMDQLTRVFTIFYGGNSALQGLPSSRRSPGDTVMNCKSAERPHRVTAVFQDTELSFDIGREATLAQLAEQLCMLGEIHGGPPLSVDIRVAVGRVH
jgi:hypothetical protein